MRFEFENSRYGAYIEINEVGQNVILDTGSPITVLRSGLIMNSLIEDYATFEDKIRKFKPIELVGFGKEVVRLYPATFDRVILAGVELIPFACYVDLDHIDGNSIIGADFISSCVINRTIGEYCIDLTLNDYSAYTRKFVDDYRATTHADVNILEELNKQSGNVDTYLEDMFGAASAAIGK